MSTVSTSTPASTRAPRRLWPGVLGRVWRRNQASPVGAVALRLALGLALLQIALTTLAGLYVERTEAGPGRTGTADMTALRGQGGSILRTLATELEHGDAASVRRLADRFLVEDPRIESIALEWPGEPALRVQRAVAPDAPAAAKEVSHVSVALRRDGIEWAHGAIDFARPQLSWWQARPWALQTGVACTIGLALAFFYLRRALFDLDPNAVIPERVRNAFDLLNQAVVLFDTRGRIVLANEAFQSCFESRTDVVLGSKIESVAWITNRPDSGPRLWRQALQSSTAIQDESVRTTSSDGRPMRLLVRGGPVVDARGQVQGGVLTFNDVTRLDQVNAELKGALDNLEASHRQIEEQNRQLAGLAHRDGLTGAMNRRGFDTELTDQLARLQREGECVSMIMVDIDKFKSINDRFGHAIGDDVIRALATTLGDHLTDADTLVRYGGEEFCVFLPRRRVDDAARVAERLRAAVEARCAAAAGGIEGLLVTASFGVAMTDDDQPIEMRTLMERADGALYRAKHNGRNRVETAVGSSTERSA